MNSASKLSTGLIMGSYQLNHKTDNQIISNVNIDETGILYISISALVTNVITSVIYGSILPVYICESVVLGSSPIRLVDNVVMDRGLIL